MDESNAPRKQAMTPSSASSSSNNVEAMMQKLRKEVRMISTNLTQVKDQSFRKSVSIMENHMTKNNEVFENHLKTVNEKHKTLVDNKTKHYEETINNLKLQLQEKDSAVDELRGRLEECRTARMEALEDLAKTKKHYSDRVKELESCIAEGRENLLLLQNERDRRKSEVDRIQKLEKSLEETRAEAQALEDKIAAFENDLKEKEKAIEQLEAVKERLESSLENLKQENEKLREDLEKSLEAQNNKIDSDDLVVKVLQDQISKIQAEWDETKRLLVLEQVNVAKLQDEICEINRQFGLTKVELRIANRNKRMAEDKLEKMEQDKLSIAKELADYQSANTTLTSKLVSFHDEVESLKNLIEAKREEHEALTAVKKELSEQKAQLEMDNSALRNEVAILKVKANEVESMEKLLDQKKEQIEAKLEIIEQKNIKIRTLQNNVDVLKEASALLDSQLREFETALDKKLIALQDSEKMKELLENENHELREQLKKCKIDLNEAKSLKAFTEKRLELTESSLKTQSQSQESEVQSMMEKLSVATARNEELSEELSALMSQVSELEGEKFEMRKKLESTTSEKDQQTKEISALVNTVVQMKEEIIALQNAVKETLFKGEKYKSMYETVLEKYNALEQSSNTREQIYTTRIDQQEKLIDYLQEQLNAAQEKKKKRGLMFTPKRNDKDVFTPAKPVTPRVPYRANPATPACLEKEKMVVQQLEEKRETLLSRLENLQKNSPGCTKSPTLPSMPKKEVSVLLKERSNTLAITSGKAHRFQESRCETTQKCMACRDPVYKGRPVSKCEVCKCAFHLACAANASKTCGLSEKSAYELEKSVSSRRAEPISDDVDDDVFKGWVYIRTEKMTKVEKLFLKIENGHLNIYGSENTSRKPFESLLLNEFTTVFFRIEKHIEETVSGLDIAFSMKVNFDSVGHHSSYMYMFHRNKKQKRYWIRGIQKYSRMHLVSSGDSTFASDLSFCSDDNKENMGAIKVNEEILLEDQRPEKMYVNCVYMLPNAKIYLLGCDDGLYSLKPNGGSPVKIEGPQAIYQIDTLIAAKTAVFIEGPKQVLSTVYLGLLKTCAEAAECSNPKFTSQMVPQTKDCYMFATRGSSLKDTVVVAAGSNVLLLCAWSDEGLRLVKQIKVKDSITTLLMTPHTVLYGNDSIYEVDTKTFEQEPFLDSTDDAVYYVQLLNENYGSYPVAILDVTQSRGVKNAEPEYLICFQDIGIFVDGFGNRSRDGDVLWSSVPISFEYRHPFLYIFHFTTVEIQKLDENSYNKMSTIPRATTPKPDNSKTAVMSRLNTPPTRFITLVPKKAPNYVGKSSAGVVVSLCDTHITKIFELNAYP